MQYISLDKCEDFDPVKIFECGQCFRWNADERQVYTGVAFGKAAKVWTENSKICISGSREDYDTLWHSYFDMDRDYEAMRKSLPDDDFTRRAADFGAGIRILRQDKWEALCSFIISQCNNIPRIKKIIETFCALYGDKINFDGDTYYSFPTAECCAELTEEDLKPLRCGYRAAYILAAARAVAAGELDLEALAEKDYTTALKSLKTLPGVGDKVANCVILFGLNMHNAFPVDVWMKKAIATHYPPDFSPVIFGNSAGLAQQYIFYYARSGNV